MASAGRPQGIQHLWKSDSKGSGFVTCSCGTSMKWGEVGPNRIWGKLYSTDGGHRWDEGRIQCKRMPYGYNYSNGRNKAPTQTE